MTQKDFINKILKVAGSQIEEQVSGLLGYKFDVTAPTGRGVTKEDFFANAPKKLVIARLNVAGEAEGEAYLFVEAKSAIHMGGVLIMLPAAELEIRVKKGHFGGEEADAFGEIANIIAGVLTATFKERSPRKLIFHKGGLDTVKSVEVDCDSNDLIPPVEYLQVSFPVTLGDKALGDLKFLFPYTLIALPPVLDASPSPGQQVVASSHPTEGSQGAPDQADTSRTAESRTAAAQGTAPSSGESGSPAEDGALERQLVLIITEGTEEGREISEALQGSAFTPRSAGIRDNLREIIQRGNVKGMVLVLQEVNEQGIAAAIKIRSAADGNVPLIAAGPQWTRTTVLKALKYGICDILVTPAQPEDVLAKISHHAKRQAATA